MIRRIKESRFIDDHERESLKKFIDDSGHSLSEWAKNLGVSKGYLSLVLNGKRAFTHDLEQRFADIGIRII